MTSKKDQEEFKEYLRNCTDAQVIEVYKKEAAAGRVRFHLLAEQECNRRNLEP